MLPSFKNSFSFYNYVYDPFWVTLCICCKLKGYVYFFLSMVIQLSQHLFQHLFKRLFFIYWISLASCKTSVDHEYKHLFLDFQFCSIDLYVSSLVRPTLLDCNSSITILKLGRVSPYNFVLILCWLWWVIHLFVYVLELACYFMQKNACCDFEGIANLYINLGIITILIFFPIKWYVVFLYFGLLEILLNDKL